MPAPPARIRPGRIRHALLAVLALAGVASHALAGTPARGALCTQANGVTPISAVQGSGPRSPLLGRTVSVQGVVTAVFPGREGLGGLFLQEPGAGDAASTASRGLFVILPSPLSPLPRPGFVLRVTGRVSEARSLTQLTAVSGLTYCGTTSVPAARTVRLPLGDAGWEALEGMRVRLPGPLTVNDVRDLGHYGELTLASGRLLAPTQGAAGHGPQALGRIVLDDGSQVRDPRPVPYLLPGGVLPRNGDTVSTVVGVVSAVADGIHAIEPTAPVQVTASNPRPPAPADVGGTLRIATFNAHNFFTTLGDRGAGSRRTYTLQRAKLVSALAGLNADAVLLDEIESNGMTSEHALLQALNARLGGSVYAAVPDPPAGVGNDRIKQAILYKPDALTLLGRASDPRALFERAPVAATFRDRSGRVLTMIAVHLKSKGGCPSAGDVDKGFGCWNLRRSAQAQAVVDFAEARARAVGSADVVIAGDLNSYAAEPPVRVFTAAGYHDAAAGVPAQARYSYVYSGEAGTLDYLFLGPSLASALSGASYWHIDADESPLLAAGGGLSPAQAARAAGASGAAGPHGAAFAGPLGATPYRASDHDPLLVGLDPASAQR